MKMLEKRIISLFVLFHLKMKSDKANVRSKNNQCSHDHNHQSIDAMNHNSSFFQYFGPVCDLAPVIDGMAEIRYWLLADLAWHRDR